MARITRVFDGAVDGVPFYRDDHPMLEADEQARVTAYLNAGAGILMTTALEPDYVDELRGDIVPISFRTDGEWIWTDALTYYVTTYGHSPEPEFLAHIAAAGYTCPEPGEEALVKALFALIPPEADLPTEADLPAEADR